MVQILDAPVPEMVDRLVDVLRLFDAAIPEQVTAVPKISWPSRPPRAILSEPQMAEQLVEVPLSCLRPSSRSSSSGTLTFQFPALVVLLELEVFMASP